MAALLNARIVGSPPPGTTNAKGRSTSSNVASGTIGTPMSVTIGAMRSPTTTGRISGRSAASCERTWSGPVHPAPRDPPEGRLGIVFGQELDVAGAALVLQLRHQVQSHVDPSRRPGGGDDLAVLDPPPGDVVGAQVLQDPGVGPVGGRLPTLEQARGREKQRSRPH